MILKKPGVIGERPALVVVDPQVDFVHGEFTVDIDKEQFVSDINMLVSAAREADLPIIWGKESHRSDHADYGTEWFMSCGDHTVEDSDGESYLSGLNIDTDQLQPAEYLVTKRQFDLFYNTDLERLLDTYEIDTVLLTGLTTHVCVHYTAHGAHNREFVVRVIEECTADRDGWKETGLQMIEHLQPNSTVSLDVVVSKLEQYDGNEIVRSVKENGSVFGQEGV
jgi:nicotinamidase-related amidase